MSTKAAIPTILTGSQWQVMRNDGWEERRDWKGNVVDSRRTVSHHGKKYKTITAFNSKHPCEKTATGIVSIFSKLTCTIPLVLPACCCIAFLYTCVDTFEVCDDKKTCADVCTEAYTKFGEEAFCDIFKWNCKGDGCGFCAPCISQEFMLEVPAEPENNSNKETFKSMPEPKPTTFTPSGPSELRRSFASAFQSLITLKRGGDPDEKDSLLHSTPTKVKNSEDEDL